jgi:hypothetical protein
MFPLGWHVPNAQIEPDQAEGKPNRGSGQDEDGDEEDRHLRRRLGARTIMEAM